ncbi:MAG: DEAD/DEAH box helicase family protein, partial [Clostridia bacterium]|nr:DEAD/DEAH box helicase family protein [Clostridia bacterium]
MPNESIQFTAGNGNGKKPTLEELAKVIKQIKDGNYPSSFDVQTYDQIRGVYNSIKRLQDEAKQASRKVVKPEDEKPVADSKTVVIEEEGSGDDVVEIDLTYYDQEVVEIERSESERVSIADSLVYSLCNRGRVDMEYMSSLTGCDYGTLAEGLKGSIYQNPETWDEKFSQGWETAEEYLSGNLMRKYRKAKYASTVYGGHFADNMKAIETVMPQSATSKEIYISLGSPWVPTWIINDFINYLLDLRKGEDKYKDTAHDEVTGSWALPRKSDYSYRRFVAMNHTYGTRRINALQILEKTLNMSTIAIYDEIPSKETKSGKKSVLNQTETNLALEKQRLITEKFVKWVWRNADRKQALEDIFERDFGCYRARNFNGSFLTLPTLSKKVTLYPYQKDAVARIIFSPNTLLAHDVGSGKTYVMIVAGMELKRMGLSSKNLYVVPNNIVAQWNDIFHQIYPQANVLCVNPNAFTPSKRTKTLEDIRDNDYDAIIMSYSCFDRIPISKRYYIEKMQEQARQLDEVLKGVKKKTPITSKRRTKIANELAKLLQSTSASTSSVFFDELGITRLFIDEAHN